MCRNIKTLYNFDPPVTPDEVRAASLQFVRKITGLHKPSKANDDAFQNAIDQIASIFAGPRRNKEESRIFQQLGDDATAQLKVLFSFFLKIFHHSYYSGPR